MWIFTPEGFVAITKDEKDPEFRHVRARRKKHLESAIGDEPFQYCTDTDYPFLARLHEDDIAESVASQVRRINYTHFQLAIPARNKHYLKSLENIWRVMQAYQFTQYYGPKTDFEKMVDNTILRVIKKASQQVMDESKSPSPRQIHSEVKHDMKLARIKHLHEHFDDWS